MSYANVDYYKNTYKGKMDDETAEIMLSRASDIVDQLAYGRIQGRGFSNLTEYQQTQIKKAVCSQADYMHELEMFPENVSSYSINGVSITVGEGGNTRCSYSTLRHIELTGLRYGGL